MSHRSNTLTLIVCGLMALITLPAMAGDSHNNRLIKAWRGTQDNRLVDKQFKSTNEDCERGQDCTKPARAGKAENQRPEKPQLKNSRQENILTREKRPSPRIRQRDDDTPTPRIDRRRHNQPTIRVITPERRNVTIRHIKPIATIKRPKHRLTYSDQIRRDYRYIRGPWYSTRYITPVRSHRHKIGYRLNVLPRHYVQILIGGFPYFYYSGIFYRPYGSSYIVVSAPIGAFVESLPAGFIAFTIGRTTYYFVDDTYYVWDENRQGYLVVAEPSGATEAIAKATSGRLMVYPNTGQSEEQQAKDRYECHRWAVDQSGIDPSLEEEEFDTKDQDNYRRAIAACLEGRGYTVK